MVISRLSDHVPYDTAVQAEWSKVRTATEQIAVQYDGTLVNTDDLNGPNNDIHYTIDGRNVQCERFLESTFDIVCED